jgi:RecB family exonuclease
MTLGDCLRSHEIAPGSDDPWRDRHERGRAAILAVIEELAGAWRAHDDTPRRPDAIARALHHVIEARTFVPRRRQEGVHLVDAVAARFCDVDHVHVVGLVDTDWADGPSRNVFYTSGLLKTLGWPQQADRIRARQASFRDLLRLAANTTTLHAFELDGDAIVGRSPMVELARGRPAVDGLPPDPAPLFSDELLTGGAADPSLFAEDAAVSEWLRLRLERPPLEDRAYRGFVGLRAPEAYRVSRVDRYVDCPFKYFAETVLRLPEEREESSGLTPLERGLLIHELFEQFYREWHGRGRRTITPAELPEALALFAGLTHAALARFPPPDRALEATRLLGSIVATGLGERVFQVEADAGDPVGERLLELPLRGAYAFPALSGLAQVPIEIRGKADRIDVLAGGALRVIDYKLGKVPDVATSLQIAVYAHCARQELERRDGRPHEIGAAMYLAFGDDRKLEGRLGDAAQSTAAAVLERVEEFTRTIQKIEAGEYPARPRRPGDCQWCRYAGVCRKEYLAEVDEAADAL